MAKIKNGSTFTDGTPLVKTVNGIAPDANHNVTVDSNGKKIELQKSTTHIQWRLVGDTSWQDLIPLTDIKGEQGVVGITGDKGGKGDTGTVDYTYVDNVVNEIGSLCQ